MFRPLFILVLLSGLIPALSRAADITLEATPALDRYVVGQPVILHCTFTNQSDSPRKLDLGTNCAEHVSFVVKDSPGHMPLTAHEAHQHGGMAVPGECTIAPHQSIRRHVVLDRCFRTPAPGRYQLEMVVSSLGEKITALVTISFDPENRDEFKKELETTFAQFAADEADWKAAAADRRNRDPLEFINYEYTIVMALSFIAQWPEDVLTDLKARYGEQSSVFRMIEEARGIGPGGSRWLD